MACGLLYFSNGLAMETALEGKPVNGSGTVAETAAGDVFFTIN
jgi:hypothetical protein